jgi:hypothetical protein
LGFGFGQSGIDIFEPIDEHDSTSPATQFVAMVVQTSKGLCGYYRPTQPPRPIQFSAKLVSYLSSRSDKKTIHETHQQNYLASWVSWIVLTDAKISQEGYTF